MDFLKRIVRYVIEAKIAVGGRPGLDFTGAVEAASALTLSRSGRDNQRSEG
jgi:hypothetical protein